MLLLEGLTPALVTHPALLSNIILAEAQLASLALRDGTRGLHDLLAADTGVGPGLHCKEKNYDLLLGNFPPHYKQFLSLRRIFFNIYDFKKIFLGRIYNTPRFSVRKSRLLFKD